jgi:hypothetical protein
MKGVDVLPGSVLFFYEFRLEPAAQTNEIGLGPLLALRAPASGGFIRWSRSHF